VSARMDDLRPVTPAAISCAPVRILGSATKMRKRLRHLDENSADLLLGEPASATKFENRQHQLGAYFTLAMSFFSSPHGVPGPRLMVK
jgi:hypothetical protein